MKRIMFLVSVLIIMSMWVSASASTLEHTDLNGGVVYTSPNLTVTINVLPKNEKVPKEIDGRNIIGYAVTNDYATVREIPNSAGKIVCQLSPGNDIYIVGVENAWYEIYSKSGNTHGFVIEDVLDLREGLWETLGTDVADILTNTLIVYLQKVHRKDTMRATR